MSTNVSKYVRGYDLVLWRKAGPKKRQAMELLYKYRDELETYPGVTRVGLGGEVVTV